MSTNQIRRAALAAAIFACTARITEGGYGGDAVVSVSLPPTEGCYDDMGNPVTIWNMGNVPAGGVTDSWHGEGGPGRFTARNTGNINAYFYLTTGYYFHFTALPTYSGPIAYSGLPYVMQDTQGLRERLGIDGVYLKGPCISPKELREYPNPYCYHLAFTTDTMAKVPTWHSLDHRYDGVWSTQERSSNIYGNEVAGFMGSVDAGDYLTFDLKFWASRIMPANIPVIFTFCVEASTFPLWDHGRTVE